MTKVGECWECIDTYGNNSTENLQWCIDQFGETSIGRWRYFWGKFIFTREEDAMWYTMRWS